MQCTGAANPVVFKWTITRRCPVIANVMWQVSLQPMPRIRVTQLA